MKPGSICIAAALAAGFMTAAAAGAQPAKDPDWPCIQVLVPALSPGQLWAGPPIDEADATWAQDPRIASLRERATGRAVKPDAIENDVQALAKEAGPDKDKALTALFAGVFETMDSRRAKEIAAIKRYARQQREIQAEIAATLHELDGAPKDSPEAARITDRLTLLRRVLDERRRSLTAVCDLPVETERRLGEMARVIAAYLE
ncbi:hypothetical protein [Arenibaculum pallidiluteum]|uniref:hypothetical protein n=1 Tax=Arenibaculum pallidiluteum TaxID=2812559 RepID=UPI001A95C181|nr:hypothetical protein [Arenibaculum pallidiluteum]